MPDLVKGVCMSSSISDLEAVDPLGRLDVLLYRGLGLLVQAAETKYGVNGVWDATKIHANKAIAKHIGNINVPVEGQILLSILQANFDKIGKQKL